jgi:hypothetical protein
MPVALAADGVGATLKVGGAIASGVADAARTAIGTGSSALSQIKNEFTGQPQSLQSSVSGPTKDQMDTYKAVNGISLPSRLPAQQPVGIQVPLAQAAPQPEAMSTKIDQPSAKPSISPTFNNPYLGKPNVSIDSNGVTQITGQSLEARPTGVSGYAPAAPQFIKIDPNTMSFADIAAARSHNKITQANMDQAIKLGNLDANNQQNSNTLRLGLTNADIARMNADSTRMNANTTQNNSDLQAQELRFRIGNYPAEQAARQAQAELEAAYKNSQIEKNKAETQKLGQAEGLFPTTLQTAYFNEVSKLENPDVALKKLEQARAQRSGAKVDQSGNLQVGPANPAVRSNFSPKVVFDAVNSVKKAGNKPEDIQKFESYYGVPYPR